ncbi:MAG TPA: hypothetical protein VFA76_16355 [Terriglobales bacterium]|nr:hypothetical protein [Terriglobales bacterium]
MEAAVSPLSQWESFYVIVGSSAGALTGLQFVVIALVADMEAATSMLEIRAFGSPTVVHFCASLLISAIMSAPWHTLSSAGYGLGACGAIGLAYAISVVRHARRQTGYHPDKEDWAWYIMLPLLGYAALLASAALLHRHPTPSLFAVAGTALLLLLIGIHNAWDTVTYMAVERGRAAKKGRE